MRKPSTPSAMSIFVASPTAENREAAILENRPLVVRLARRFFLPRASVMTMDDLIQEGMVGLIEAVDHFDATRGFAFSSFAVRVVFNAILKKVADEFNLPIRIGDLSLAECWNPLDELVDERTPVEEAAEHEEIAEIRAAINALAAPDRVVLLHRFGSLSKVFEPRPPRTAGQISEITGRSKQAVQQHASRATKRLRRAVFDARRARKPQE